MNDRPSGQIYQLLPRAAADIGPVAKSRKNSQQNYSFRGIEDVMNAVNPVLARHGISTVPRVTDLRRDEKATQKGGQLTVTVLTVDYYFFAPDGSCVVATVVGEGMDSGDKSANKAMSAAFKYAVGQVLNIPFEVVDSEDDDPEPAPAANHARPGGGPSPAMNRSKITAEQAANLHRGLAKYHVPMEAFCEEFSVETVEEIATSVYGEACHWIANHGPKFLERYNALAAAPEPEIAKAF